MSGLTVADPEVRAGFEAAAEWFLIVLGAIPARAWDDPGLGEWTVKELAAHTARAFTTVEQYLTNDPVDVVITDPVAYFRTAMATPGANAAVAERGRQAAAALGDDPVSALVAIATRVRATIASTADDAVCDSFVGGIRFPDYLATRVLELTVHTTDLCAALGRDDQPPEAAAMVTFAVLGGLAAAEADRATLLRGLTGRTAIPAGRSVLG